MLRHQHVASLIFLGSLTLVAGMLNCSDGTEAAIGQTGTGGVTSTSSGAGGIIFEDGGPGPGPGGNGGGTTNTGGKGGSGEGGMGMASVLLEKTFGGAGNVFPRDLAVDSKGNIIIVGAFDGLGVTFGGAAFNSSGKTDSFIVKYDSTGQHIFSERHGDKFVQSINAVAIDSADNIIVTGTNEGQMTIGGMALDNVGTQFADSFVVKLGPSGNATFAKGFGIGVGQSDFGFGIAVDINDNILLVGTFEDQIAFGGSPVSDPAAGYGFYLAKLNPSGDHVFSHAFGDAKRQDGLGVAVALDGSIAIVGTTEGDIDFGDGNHPNSAGARAVVARFDSNGQPKFSHLYTGDGDSAGMAVAFDKSGNLYVTGNFRQSIDMGGASVTSVGGADTVFVARYDANHNLSYGVKFGSGGTEKVNALAVDSMGYAVITGQFNKDLKVHSATTLMAVGTSDGFVIKIGAQGYGYWGYVATGDQSQAMTAVFMDASDNTWVAGNFASTVDLGNGPTQSNGGLDMFFAQYSP